MLTGLLIRELVSHPIVGLVIAAPIVIFLAHQKWHGERLMRKARAELADYEAKTNK